MNVKQMLSSVMLVVILFLLLEKCQAVDVDFVTIDHKPVVVVYNKGETTYIPLTKEEFAEGTPAIMKKVCSVVKCVNDYR